MPGTRNGIVVKRGGIEMKAIIGVSSSLKEDVLSVSMNNIDAITRFGGIPFVLPNIAAEHAAIIAERIDGLLLTGGGDIDPTLFGEEPHKGLGSITPERDLFELAIIAEMLRLDKPILGICRGAQILNVAVDGDMYQDIYSQIDTELLQHGQQAPRWHASHFVHVREGSFLYKIVQMEQFKVNSFHHQANRSVPTGFEISAISSDGVVEAFESRQHKFVMGVQWHPECLLGKNDFASAAIFRTFIEACSA